MSITLAIFYLALGFVVLIKSATYLIDSINFVAKVSRVPKFIIGATLVSLITTTPELFISISSTIRDENEFAIANAIGTVIFNTGIILSLVAIFRNSKIDRVNIFEKTAIMVLSIITLTVFSRDYYIEWYEGMIQFILVFIYAYLNSISIIKGNSLNKQNKFNNRQKKITRQILIIIFCALLIFLISAINILSIREIINQIKPSEVIINFMLIIITSLPELSIAIVALLRKHQSIVIGNVLGANIINLTFICGFSGIISHIGLKIMSITYINDLLIFFLLLLILLLPMILNGKIKKKQGYIGISIYILYIIYTLFFVVE